MTKLIKVLKQEQSQSAINNAYKKAKKTEFESVYINYQPSKTRMAVKHEVGHSLYNTY